jgi:hypothetical protein
MSARSVRLLFEAALFLAALGLGAAAFDLVDDTVADALYFGAWCAAMLLIFSLALRLPLHLRGRLARLANPGIVGAALGLALLANIALYRHDAHFDATVSGRFTPPPELETIARSQRHLTVMQGAASRPSSSTSCSACLCLAVARGGAYCFGGGGNGSRTGSGLILARIALRVWMHCDMK